MLPLFACSRVTDEQAPKAKIEISPIVFKNTNEINIKNAEFICEIESLEKHLPTKTYVLINTSERRLNQFISNLGFDVEQYKIISSEMNFSDSSKSLRIDQYGEFELRYNNMTEEIKEFPLTEEECKLKAKKYLEDNGLWEENFSGTILKETSSLWKNDTGEKLIEDMIVGMTVEFDDEKTSIGKEFYISIKFNSNGEIKKVLNKYRKYEIKEEVEVVSIAEAYESISENNALIYLTSNPKTLIFEEVYLGYWSEIPADISKAVRQPIYTFVGTSLNINDEEEKFSIAVNAVDFEKLI